jgi:hypothetical protein
MFAAAFTSALFTPTFASTPTLGFTFTLAPPMVLPSWPVAEPVVEDWSVEALCEAVDDELMSVELWFALTLLDTDWSPPCPLRSTLIPGLTFAPRFTSLLPRFTFASTPTFGLAFTLVPALPPVAAGSVAGDVALDCVLDALWSIVEEELMSVELWFAVTPLETLWSPLPTFTPGLIFAPAFTSVLLIPTLASTPTFGFTLTLGLVLSCANAGLNAASTAAAAALSNSLFRLMHGLLHG